MGLGIKAGRLGILIATGLLGLGAAPAAAGDSQNSRKPIPVEIGPEETRREVVLILVGAIDGELNSKMPKQKNETRGNETTGAQRRCESLRWEGVPLFVEIECRTRDASGKPRVITIEAENLQGPGLHAWRGKPKRTTNPNPGIPILHRTFLFYEYKDAESGSSCISNISMAEWEAALNEVKLHHGPEQARTPEERNKAEQAALAAINQATSRLGARPLPL